MIRTRRGYIIKCTLYFMKKGDIDNDSDTIVIAVNDTALVMTNNKGVTQKLEEAAWCS